MILHGVARLHFSLSLSHEIWINGDNLHITYISSNRTHVFDSIHISSSVLKDSAGTKGNCSALFLFARRSVSPCTFHGKTICCALCTLKSKAQNFWQNISTLDGRHRHFACVCVCVLVYSSSAREISNSGKGIQKLLFIELFRIWMLQ